MPQSSLLACFLSTFLAAGGAGDSNPAVQVHAVDSENPVKLVGTEILHTRSAPAASPTPAVARPSEQDHHDAVVANLRTQSVLRTARQQIAENRFAEAIQSLEGALAEADGNPVFLETLGDAYRGEIAQLLRDRQSDQARLLADRLRILTSEEPPSDPAVGVSLQEPAAAAPDKTPSVFRRAFQTVKSTIQRTPSEGEKPESEPAVVESRKPAYEARAKLDDQPETTSSNSDFQRFYRNAEQLFAEQKYEEAISSFEQAYEADAVAVQAGRERWGYCLLWRSYHRFNQWIASTNSPELDTQAVEGDLKLACQLAPALQAIIDSDRVLERIEAERNRRRAVATRSGQPSITYANASPGPIAPTERPIQPNVRHLPGQSQGWSIVESTNFRIYHRDPALAEAVAQSAEEARVLAFQKWFSQTSVEPWSPRCEIVLYPSAQEYAQATGVGPQSPGHTKVEHYSGRIVSRRIELRTDDTSMKGAVLPHEVTHAVLADGFLPHTLPRWADEGMAVLTEPRAKQEAHLANLVNLRLTGNRFQCGQLMTMSDYPQQHMQSFYAHSVGLCRFLVERYGAKKLADFLKASLQSNNYELALRQVYGMPSFAQLEAEFEGYISSMQSPVNFASAAR